jgi:hypothetical protein
MVFLLGALLVGGVLGFTADRVLAKDALCQPMDRKSMRERFHNDLGLDASQRLRVDSLLDLKHAQIAEVMKPIQPRLESISDTTRAQIAKLLTPAQQQRFEEMHQEMLARRKASPK